MQVRKGRWSKVYESSEEELVAFLRERRIRSSRWSAAEFETLPVRRLPQPTDIYLAEGSATFIIDGTSYSMQPGDIIRLPAESSLGIEAGMSGCVCYEALRQPSLATHTSD